MQKRRSGIEEGLDIDSAVAVEAGGGDGLEEDDANGDEDGADAKSERDSDFDARTFGVLIAAAEAEAAFGKIFADSDFFVEAAVADAGEDAGLDAGAVAAGNDAFLDRGCGGASAVIRVAEFGERFDPDGGRIANAAVPRDAFADFERFELNFVEIDDFAALAEAALHEKTRENFLDVVWSGEVNVPEIGAGIEKVDSV